MAAHDFDALFFYRNSIFISDSQYDQNLGSRPSKPPKYGSMWEKQSKKQ
jgi:hypothetical protein